jgi:hypothetical protein
MTCLNGDEEICPNEKCGTNLKDLKRKHYFIEIPIESQLLNILKRNNTLSLLKERFKRKKKNETGIEDIYDGTVYQKRIKQYQHHASVDCHAMSRVNWHVCFRYHVM